MPLQSMTNPHTSTGWGWLKKSKPSQSLSNWISYSIGRWKRVSYNLHCGHRPEATPRVLSVQIVSTSPVEYTQRRNVFRNSYGRPCLPVVSIVQNPALASIPPHWPNALEPAPSTHTRHRETEVGYIQPLLHGHSHTIGQHQVGSNEVLQQAVRYVTETGMSSCGHLPCTHPQC